MSFKRALVLDIDETLVHTRAQYSDEIQEIINLGIFKSEHYPLQMRLYRMALYDTVERPGTGVLTEMWGFTRPHLRESILLWRKYFDYIIVWSAGKARYVYGVCSYIFGDLPKPDLIISDADFTDDDYMQDPDDDRGRSVSVKNIMKFLEQRPDLKSKLPGLTAAGILCLDDRWSTFLMNPDNGVLIPKYQPECTFESLEAPDNSLQQFNTWLQRPEVVACRDYRTLDKTHIFN
jgi:hypothetical protein